MGSHDELVYRLNNEVICNLLSSQFGNHGCYCKFGWVVQNDVGKWGLDRVFNLPLTEETLEEIKERFTKEVGIIQSFQKCHSLVINKTFEFPLIKGEGAYKCTKGFIDLIIHAQTQKMGEIYCYTDPRPIEFIIEIKNESDFKDFGAILRQIKEYKEFYNGWGVQKWDSSIIIHHNESLSGNDVEDGRGKVIYKRKYCILSTKIPEEAKRIFTEEGILCLELDSAAL